METSKLLVLFVTCKFTAVLVFCMAAWLLKGEFPGDILTVDATFSGVVISGYYGKAGFENWRKIGGIANYGHGNPFSSYDGGAPY